MNTPNYVREANVYPIENGLNTSYQQSPLGALFMALHTTDEHIVLWLLKKLFSPYLNVCYMPDKPPGCANQNEAPGYTTSVSDNVQCQNA